MNTKVTGNPVGLIRNLIRVFFQRLNQNPEFYNIKYYTKPKGRNHNQNNW